MLGLRGLSQKDLADTVGVTPAAVNGWVNGRATPRSEKMLAIADALGVTGLDALHHRVPASAPDELKWIFRAAPADGGREGGGVAGFAFSASLDVLAREATQNSIDERLPDGPPVHSAYTLHELSGLHLRDFLDAVGWATVEEHIVSAADPAQKVGRVLRDGLELLHREERLVLLRVDDYHANGLTGPEFGDGRFARVVRRTLDSGKAGGQGGSYGLGKAALWAASRFGLVLVNSTLSTPEEGRSEHRISGRLELPWHRHEGSEYAGPAWFGVPDAERSQTARSWWGDDKTAARLYLTREEDAPGTSLLIVGAYDGSGRAEGLEGMYERLVDSLSTNFWAAMVGGRRADAKVRCSVAAYRNGTSVLPRTYIDPHEVEPARARAVQAFLDGETVEEVTDRKQVLQTEVLLELRARKDGTPAVGEGSHRAVLLIASADDQEPDPDHLTLMRSSRMVVKSKRVGELPLGHRAFQAVLLAGNATLDGTPEAAAAEQMLRASEPPDHNDWVGTEDLTATYERGARQKILEFKQGAEQKVRELLRPQQGEEEEDAGPVVLTELLRLGAPKVAGPRKIQAFPTVKSVEGDLDGTGAWDLIVTVRIPQQRKPTDALVIQPVPRFWFGSGPGAAVSWKEIIPLDRCELTPLGNLVCDPHATQVRFRAITDVTSHPVVGAMSRVSVDIRRAQEVVV
ncbi:helix-turn-helix domain-containing protein [Streptomyces flavotricini]|uniref:Helix-turn-helix domain-containing protein n=2 Tax=Streptomyces TaxID=1883 RepID=A0ABS8EAI1_9ACTN|nr:helix-turn-helix domain-containing protein [Streptomyces flavotricini]